MDDLISRQAAIDIVRFECGEWRGLAKTIENGLNDLPSAEPKTDDENAPTIDAVEVVRCKDCIHYDSDMICNVTDTVCDNDDYCSYGEREERSSE